MLVSLFASSLRRTTPESQWGTYLLARGEWSEIDVYIPQELDDPDQLTAFRFTDMGTSRYRKQDHRLRFSRRSRL